MQDFVSRNYVKYGLLMAMLNAAWILLMHTTGQYDTLNSEQPLYDLLFITITPLIIWFLALRDKKREQKGKLTWKEGVMEALRISVVYGITSPFIYAGYYLFLNPAVLTYIKAEYGLGSTPDSITIAFDMLVQFASAILGGAIYGALISFFLKSK